ncbi:MAG: glycosyltransferase [Halobaculum sp.]
MSDRDPVSVLLPTVEWTAACDQMAEQLDEDDEMLVICDSEDDPVTDRKTPPGVETLVAGDPVACSGKANAIAHGLEHASNDRFVWTDADFDRADDWLDELVAAGETHGPATAIMFYYGGGFWAPMEPWTAMLISLGLYLNVGTAGDLAWGGGLTFTRAELDVSVAELAAELRQVVADDVLTAQHLDDIHPVRSLVMPVAVPGDARSSYYRLLRLGRQAHVHEGMYGDLVVATAAVAAAIAFPIPVAVIVTVATGLAYLLMGVRRPTFLLSFLGLFALPVIVLSCIVCSEFEWAGRRYRLVSEYEVEVLGEDD